MSAPHLTFYLPCGLSNTRVFLKEIIMSELTKDQVVDFLSNLSIIEVSALVKEPLQ